MEITSKETAERRILPGMKLYVITRRDIPDGDQAAQSCHAAVQFWWEHPGIGLSWFQNSNTLELRVAKDEAELQKLLRHAQELDVRCSSFHEPDMNNQLTAVALEPCPKTRRLTEHLPRTLSKRARMLSAQG